VKKGIFLSGKMVVREARGGIGCPEEGKLAQGTERGLHRSGLVVDKKSKITIGEDVLAFETYGVNPPRWGEEALGDKTHTWVENS